MKRVVLSLLSVVAIGSYLVYQSHQKLPSEVENIVKEVQSVHSKLPVPSEINRSISSIPQKAQDAVPTARQLISASNPASPNPINQNHSQALIDGLMKGKSFSQIKIPGLFPNGIPLGNTTITQLVMNNKDRIKAILTGLKKSNPETAKTVENLLKSVQKTEKQSD